MDRLYNSPWFAKAIAFFIAVMLFVMVNFDNVNNQTGSLPMVSTGSFTIQEVPVDVYYNEAEYAITEITEYVQVNLRGPQSVITFMKITPPTYEVFIDLRNLEVGTHDVNVQYEGFPNELTAVDIVPQSVRVTIEEKKTVSLPIEIDFINKAEVTEDYTIGTPIVNPVNVEITAAESIIEQVAFAKGIVDLKDVTKTVERSVPIKVYDQQGNELDIDISPTVVDVKIPVTGPNKEVALKLNQVGELPKGLSIHKIYTEPKEVTIYGPLEVIDGIAFIEGVEIDLSEITQKTILEVKVPVPEGVEEVSPAIVKVVVEVAIEETIEIEDIAVEIIGLPERMDISFVRPEEEVMTLTAKGSPSTIERLRKDDIKMYIDVNQLSIGEHTVPVQINGPQNVTFEIEFDEVVVLISEVSSAEEEPGETT